MGESTGMAAVNSLGYQLDRDVVAGHRQSCVPQERRNPYGQRDG